MSLCTISLIERLVTEPVRLNWDQHGDEEIETALAEQEKKQVSAGICVCMFVPIYARLTHLFAYPILSILIMGT